MHRDQKDSMPTGAPAMTSPPCKAGSKRASYWASASRGDTIGLKGPLPSRPRPSLADQPQYPPDVDEIGVGRSVNAIAVMEGIETGAESLHQQSDAGQGRSEPVCCHTQSSQVATLSHIPHVHIDGVGERNHQYSKQVDGQALTGEGTTDRLLEWSALDDGYR